MSNWTFCRSLHNEILFALWFKTTLQNDFVVMKLNVKLILFPLFSQWNPICSLTQNYSSKWLCSDNSSLVSNFKSRCHIEFIAAVFTMKSCLLFDSNYPSKSFVVMKLVFWVISSPDVKMNLLPQSSQWNPVCSLIQIYSSNWLCGDETSLVSNLKSRCQIEPFAAVLTMKSCFSFIHENSFKDLWCFPWVFLFNLKFQYQYLIFFFDTYQFQYLEKLLWNMTLWWWYMSWIFKSRCQIEPLVTGQTHESSSLFDSKLICNMTLLMIIHFLHFQVQISNWTSCHSENVWILLALWFNTTLQYDFVVIIHVLDFQVQMSNWTSCHKPNT